MGYSQEVERQRQRTWYSLPVPVREAGAGDGTGLNGTLRGRASHSSRASRSPYNHVWPRAANSMNDSIQWTSRVFISLFLILIAATPILADMCQFPAHWAGTWFQKGIPDPIRIIGRSISEKGNCTQSSGEKFLIENSVEKCLRCMVINEKHINVLQYKETYCSTSSRSKNLNDVCSEINGDAPLYSLFRLETSAVPCPFLGPFKFSYSRGHGECREPLSSIDSCTDNAHLLFRFQACADVQGSESRVEELECLAEWKEGSVRYLVGKLYHSSSKTDEDKFRCFVFEKQKEEGNYQIAQSGDATCDGLLSTTEGSRVMKLANASSVQSQCHFPSWLTSQRHWKTLDGSQIYDFSRNSTFRVFNATNGEIIRFATCSREESSNEAFSEFVVHSTFGCKIGFVCLRIHRRSSHIMEIEKGGLVKDRNDACTHHLRPHAAAYLTLTTYSQQLKECPVEGVYAVDTGDENNLWIPSNDKSLFICSEQSFLSSRCNSAEHMQLRSRCSSTSDATRNFYCLGGWQENGTNFLIVSSNEDKMQYCLRYDESDNRAFKMTINSATCHRSLGAHNSNSFPHLNTQRDGVAFNLISHGLCHSVGGATSAVHITMHSSFMLNFLFIHLLFKFVNCL